MIVTIEGILERATPVSAIINVSGLGYLVNIPVTTAEKLPHSGEKAKLHTHVVYREDSQSMYGFAEEADRDFFVLIIDKVSGVGPKVAISLLSKLPLASLIAAIASEDVKLLSKTPGIGKKTAERVVMELKDKLAAFSGGSSIQHINTSLGDFTSLAPEGSATADAVLALTALGYKQTEAQKSIDAALQKLGHKATTEELIKLALG
ncbi:MAG: Holliday junction branch migration protein RuvA [Verrucomicrobiota bacterium]